MNYTSQDEDTIYNKMLRRLHPDTKTYNVYWTYTKNIEGRGNTRRAEIIINCPHIKRKKEPTKNSKLQTSFSNQ